MKSLRSRIEQLEHRTGVDTSHIQLIVNRAGQRELALDMDRCNQILAECGFVSTGRMSLLNFLGVPDGLDSRQLERHLREHASEICHTGARAGAEAAVPNTYRY